MFNNMEKYFFDYGDIYKIIYFYSTLIILVRYKRESPNTISETNYPLRKTLKINYCEAYKSFYWVNSCQIINTLKVAPLNLSSIPLYIWFKYCISWFIKSLYFIT